MFQLCLESSLLTQHTFACFVSNKRFGTGHSKMTDLASASGSAWDQMEGSRHLRRYCDVSCNTGGQQSELQA